MPTIKKNQAPQPHAPQPQARGEREAAKRARKLRRQTSDDEQKLWHQLRDKQIDGFRFKRQRAIGKYIVDFVCDEAKLIVELRDHVSDATPVEKARAAYFKAQGYLVLPMLNHEVSASIKTGLEAIRNYLRGDVAVVEEIVKPKKIATRKVANKAAAELKLDADITAEADAPAKKVIAKKPAAKKAVAKKVAALEATDEPAMEKSAAKKLAVKKPAATKKPAVKKPAAKQKANDTDEG